MAVRYKLAGKGTARGILKGLRRRIPERLRLAEWKRSLDAILSRKEYRLQTPLFKAIEIETRTRCNSSCSFCAASILTDQRPDILMPEALYDKLLTQLADLGYRGSIRFFVNNEPLLDKRTADFIHRAKAKLPGIFTEVHTNGLKLNPRSGRELLEAGLDLLYINNYSQTGELHRGVKAFLDEVPPSFPDRQVVLHMRLLDEQLLNRGGTAPNGRSLRQPLELPCLLPFEELVLTADGRVTICCQDHYFEAAVGNLNEHRVEEIWFGEGLQSLRRALLEGNRNANKFCQACDFRGYKEEHLTKAESLRNRLVGALREDWED